MSGGRAERMRLAARRDMAGRASQLLERKQRILNDELERIELHAYRVRREWSRAAVDAALWGRRAAALGGDDALEAGPAGHGLSVEVQWSTVMGVRIPENARCLLPEQSRSGGSSALPFAVAAYRRAIDAAARAAAVERAVRLLGREIRATRDRRRAVDDHVIPRLDERLLRVQEQLDEQELEEALRLRWSADVVAALRPRRNERHMP
jgi:V/A-type H+-transporting ATPase subunit D